ncbi:uncharacterized protein BKCO1_7500010 [Diplodia corticola]|uniref:MARVEL domain-containing protein n=1 Tax=Diplodia corticola TaxID=236234 RepID=A0A1J9RMD7_9PEZI|nr:uncharacterized protein BKCO1_7500010 [Diplodia corticola]OJD29671.1 hypothetical protein BKCO1_7500010 [Diplodia corticola]
MTQSNTHNQTGLLTRCLPERFKHGAFYRWFLRFTRLLQFLSAVISLGIFSSRVYKVYRLTNAIKRRHGINHSFGAVEGILAAAVLYTLISTLLGCILKGRGAKWLRWLWVLLDLAFVGAFTAVAVLTRPNGGPAGPRHCYTSGDNDRSTTGTGRTGKQDDTCNLPWGTFILAIISTILHAITAAFHEVRDHRRKKSASDMESANGGYAESKRSMDPHGRHGNNGHGNDIGGGHGGHDGNLGRHSTVDSDEMIGIRGSHAGREKH